MHSFARLIAEIPKFGARNIAGLIWRFHVHLRGVTKQSVGPATLSALSGDSMFISVV